MVWVQRELQLHPFSRGFHLITSTVWEAIPEAIEMEVGLLHLFIQHTSASLTINENADPDVRVDLEETMNHLVPQELPYVHSMEGPDDMPAHVKASLMGSSLSVPITHGRLALGMWQGIYLCEHRDHAGPRSLVLTIFGVDPNTM
ncbi:secondary thiamine-phosphate synthase enzyme YjbQ [Lignipirellula cremea]|uniref:Secondary thiamine-phosphate synthase enzyme n=1 Tax=Lignipirellula cremea TaxID=2528010 RepID=A0A518DR50_9BACT|nr:secondary thiamine-phosphate synthase enzyme YjbQ [Lignipirellula cremea]QDU94315.1 hypothetical protein Pla8534_21040 [Lignipirellula cremea]